MSTAQDFIWGNEDWQHDGCLGRHSSAGFCNRWLAKDLRNIIQYPNSGASTAIVCSQDMSACSRSLPPSPLPAAAAIPLPCTRLTLRLSMVPFHVTGVLASGSSWRSVLVCLQLEVPHAVSAGHWGPFDHPVLLSLQFDPGFGALSTVTYTQSGTTATMVVVRPLAHPTYPISNTGSTSMVYATG